MSVIVARFVKAPASLEWWEHGKLLGMVALGAVFGGMLAGAKLDGWVVGLAFHTVLDFTLQSNWVAANKGNRGKALLFHAIIAGGLPGAIKGMMSGGLVGCLIGVVLGTTSHYAIDWSRKYGIKDLRIAIVTDQLSHLVVLLLI